MPNEVKIEEEHELENIVTMRSASGPQVRRSQRGAPGRDRLQPPLSVTQTTNGLTHLHDDSQSLENARRSARRTRAASSLDAAAAEVKDGSAERQNRCSLEPFAQLDTPEEGPVPLPLVDLAPATDHRVPLEQRRKGERRASKEFASGLPRMKLGAAPPFRLPGRDDLL